MKNPKAQRERKAKRQAEAIARNEAYQKLSVEEKQKRNPKKEIKP